MVRKLADGTEKRLLGLFRYVLCIESSLPIVEYCSSLLKWLGFNIGKKVGLRFGSVSWWTARAVEKRSSCAASVVDKGLATLAASAVTDDADNVDDWNLENAVMLDDVEQVCARRHLRDFQDSRAKNCNVAGTIAQLFEFDTSLLTKGSCRCRSGS